MKKCTDAKIAAKKAVGKYPSIRRFCADVGCCNNFENDVENQLKRDVDISARIKNAEKSSLNDGLLRGLSLALTAFVAFQKIMNSLFPSLRLCVQLPLFDY